MDGLLAFLQDPAFEQFETILPNSRPLPDAARANQTGAPAILFVDDFDHPDPPPAAAPPEPEYIEPVFTAADMEAAREAGHAAGLEEARTEHHAVQAQLCAAAMTAIGDALAATRQDAEAIATRTAEDLAAAMLALLQAALPAASEALAGQELTALLAAILPPLKREPAVQLRLHPDMLPDISADLHARFPEYAARLTISADAALARADATVIWEDGEMRRDTSQLWNDIRTALAPYQLPSLGTILKGADHGQ